MYYICPGSKVPCPCPRWYGPYGRVHCKVPKQARPRKTKPIMSKLGCLGFLRRRPTGSDRATAQENERRESDNTPPHKPQGSGKGITMYIS